MRHTLFFRAKTAKNALKNINKHHQTACANSAKHPNNSNKQPDSQQTTRHKANLSAQNRPDKINQQKNLQQNKFL